MAIFLKVHINSHSFCPVLGLSCRLPYHILVRMFLFLLLGQIFLHYLVPVSVSATFGLKQPMQPFCNIVISFSKGLYFDIKDYGFVLEAKSQNLVA